MLKILQSHSQCHQHHQIAVPAFARWCCQWWSYSYLQWAVCTTWRWKSQCPPCHRWAPIPQSSATASRYLTVMGASSFNDRFFPGTRTPACRSLSCNKKHTEHNYWRHVLMLVHDSIHIVYGYISCVYIFIYFIYLYIYIYIYIFISLYILIYLYVPIQTSKNCRNQLLSNSTSRGCSMVSGTSSCSLSSIAVAPNNFTGLWQRRHATRKRSDRWSVLSDMYTYRHCISTTYIHIYIHIHIHINLYTYYIHIIHR